MDEDINLFTNGMVELDLADDNTLQRRELLKGAGTLTVWLAASNLSAAQTAPPELASAAVTIRTRSFPPGSR